MSFVADLATHARFLYALPTFLRRTISLDDAEQIVRRRMAERENNFLRLIERGVFGFKASPYLPLLQLAQIELGDIRSMVRNRGLEGTLRALREAGVYITFEEFKGREPVVRQGRMFRVRARDFDNPYLSHCYEVETGGTTGAGIRVQIDLDHLAERAPYDLLAYRAYGVLDAPTAMWYGVLPDSTGVGGLLRDLRIGKTPEKWFVPVVNPQARPALKYRLATGSIIAVAGAFRAPIPRPEPVGLDQAVVVARWAAQTLKTRGTCFIRALASRALRVCLAAREHGLELTGAVFSGGGEPPTPAKVGEITRMGARCFPSYVLSDAGTVGRSCASPVDHNDQHFFGDSLALIQYKRTVPGANISVDAFHFTTLLPTSPKLMLNVESDDYGVIERRRCGCPLESYGFTEHLRHIRSFRKLTGEGVTLVGSEMIRVLEEVLPAKFGGSPLDYQLMEEEDERGFTRLSLLISPKLAIADEGAVIAAVQDALASGSVAADLASKVWKQAGTLRVKRIEPIWTDRGKLMPLHLLRQPNR